MDVESISQMSAELEGFLAEFSECGNGSIQTHIHSYVRGQAALIDRKNVQQIAVHSGANARTLQEFLANYQWDHESMRHRIQKIVARDHLASLPKRYWTRVKHRFVDLDKLLRPAAAGTSNLQAAVQQWNTQAALPATTTFISNQRPLTNL